MPSQKQIFIINSPSSSVSNIDAKIMISACITLLQQVAIFWEKLLPEIVFWDDVASQGAKIATDARRFFIIDETSGIPEALRLHPEKNIQPAGFIYTRAILLNGGTLVDGSDGKQTISAALFRILAESLVNPIGNIWWNDSLSGEFIAGKICDPVDSTPVVVTIALSLPDKKQEYIPKQSAGPTTVDEKEVDDIDPNMPELEDDLTPTTMSELKKYEEQNEQEDPPVEESESTYHDKTDSRKVAEDTKDKSVKIDVTLCNFVFPEWSNPQAVEGTRLDFMSVLKHPFQIYNGGCCFKYESHGEQHPRLIFDRQYPVWRRNLKRMQIVTQNAILTTSSKLQSA